MIKQINEYYDILEKYKLKNHNYKVGDFVYLKKNTLLHGTYKNIEGLKEIVNNGLIASLFTKERTSKYPGCVGVWNLKEDYYLKDYINFYSGGTIKYSGLLINNEYSQEIKTGIIPYNKMNKINDYILNNPCRIWNLEQTKEARFLPSLIQDKVQIGIIFNGCDEQIKKLLSYDILDNNILNEIKKLLPNSYICNLDGKAIIE